MVIHESKQVADLWNNPDLNTTDKLNVGRMSKLKQVETLPLLCAGRDLLAQETLKL